MKLPWATRQRPSEALLREPKDSRLIGEIHYRKSQYDFLPRVLVKLYRNESGEDPVAKEGFQGVSEESLWIRKSLSLRRNSRLSFDQAFGRRPQAKPKCRRQYSPF